MKAWQTPPRALPITVRPMGNESVLSYVYRLAEANHLRYPTLFRHIAPCTPGKHWLPRTEAYLNAAAVQRLAVLCGHSPQGLARALPLFRIPFAHDPSTVTDQPQLWSRKFSPQRACRRCTLQLGWTGVILLHNAATRRVCERHGMWTYWEHHDLATTPEVVKAHRQFRKLIGTRPHILFWYRRARHIMKSGKVRERGFPNVLRWRERAARLEGPGPGSALTFRRLELIRFPETVALTRFLTDPTWGCPPKTFGPVPRSYLKAASERTGIELFTLWYLLIQERAEQAKRDGSGNRQFKREEHSLFFPR